MCDADVVCDPHNVLDASAVAAEAVGALKRFEVPGDADADKDFADGLELAIIVAGSP